MTSIQVRTTERTELIDITDRVREQVSETKVQDGICVISTKHTTTSIIVNENESGLVSDILELLERIIPEHSGYAHDRIDNNADAHLKSVLLGCSGTIPIVDGELVLGTWQRTFLAELDGPRTREVMITVISAQ